MRLPVMDTYLTLKDFLLRYSDAFYELYENDINNHKVDAYINNTNNFAFINGMIYYNNKSSNLSIHDYDFQYVSKIENNPKKDFLEKESRFPKNYRCLPFKFAYSNSDFICHLPLTTLKNIPSFTNGRLIIHSKSVNDWGDVFSCKEFSFKNLPEPPLDQMKQFIQDKTYLSTNNNDPWVIAIKLINGFMDYTEAYNHLVLLPNFVAFSEIIKKLGREDLINLIEIPFVKDNQSLNL